MEKELRDGKLLLDETAIQLESMEKDLRDGKKLLDEVANRVEGMEKGLKDGKFLQMARKVLDGTADNLKIGEVMLLEKYGKNAETQAVTFKRPPLANDSKTNVSTGEDLSKERGGRQIAVLGITDSLNARSRGENEAKELMEMPTQRSELDFESALARGMTNASTEKVEATQLSEAVSMNDYILRAAADNVVIHPGLVKMKGNIDQRTFRVKTKDEIMELEEAMQSDRNSEHEKGQQQAKAVATNKPAPAIKWGDTKSVLFETTSQLTFDDDEIIDEPDLYR